MRSSSALRASVGLVAATLWAAGERDASACGGCLRPPQVETVITDEKMMLAVSKDQTTLYDEIKYSGSPSSFAWVLPIRGTVTVGLSAAVLFSTIDAMTASTVIPPTSPCAYYSSASGSSGTGGGSSGTGSSGSGVTVLATNTVGPYETVQLKSSDGSALYNWLKGHGYEVPAADKAVMDDYVTGGFNFLAMKLVPGAGIQEMQPVRVTTKGASVSLPMHMVAVGTGATTGISVWVVADGRYEPKNFPTFTISDSELIWDWTTNSSNYETLRLAKEATFGGRGWQIESSLEISEMTIQNNLLNNIYYGSEGGAYPLPDAGGDATLSEGDGGYFTEAGATYEDTTAMADLGVLFAGITGPNVRITRMRSDVAHSALSVDMFLKASADQGELSNLHYPKKATGDLPCPYFDGGDFVDGAVYYLDGGGLASTPQTIHSGCSTTSEESPRTTLAVLLGVVGFGAAGIRRRRRRSASGR